MEVSSFERGGVRNQLETFGDEVASEGAREHDREDREIARQDHAGDRRTRLGRKGELLRLLDEFLQLLWRRRNASLFKKCLVVKQTLRCVANRNTYQLAADGNALHKAGAISPKSSMGSLFNRSSSGSNSEAISDVGRLSIMKPTP